jgi:hypothetical protein
MSDDRAWSALDRWLRKPFWLNRGVCCVAGSACSGAPVALAVSRFRFAKLRRVRPRPYALAEVPPHMPQILWSEGYGQGLTEIVLAYGHPHEVSKPLIQVMTCFSEEHCWSPPLEEAIARRASRCLLCAFRMGGGRRLVRSLSSGARPGPEP